ncbi:MAG: sigma-70 family RNA polymerase sigma factor [Gemmatimonadetes bacterium]|nr:sigma-70 family RNA polymerase sigma factor [Gemmatimonadota bacterium]
MAPRDELEALITRVAKRDTQAFAVLYDRTSGYVFGLLLRILHDREIAEEVAQEIYLQLWRTAATFDAKRSSVLAWIAMVARSRAIDRLRSDLSQRDALQELSAEAPPSGNPDPAEEASLRERRAWVREAVGSLPVEQRRTIELAFFEGLTHTEIASRTDTPLGTVKTRIRSAIGKLEQALRTLRP